MIKLKVGDLVWLRHRTQTNRDAERGVVVSRETWRNMAVCRVKWPTKDNPGLYFVHDIMLIPHEVFCREDFDERIKDRMG